MSTSSTFRASCAWPAVMAVVAVAGTLAGCDRRTPESRESGAGTTKPAAAQAETAAPSAAPAPSEETSPRPAYETGLPESVRANLAKPFTGDFDEMVARRLVRVGVTYNRTYYFVDQGVLRGVAYELGKAFEDDLNKRLETGNANGRADAARRGEGRSEGGRQVAHSAFRPVLSEPPA